MQLFQGRQLGINGEKKVAERMRSSRALTIAASVLLVVGCSNAVPHAGVSMPTTDLSGACLTPELARQNVGSLVRFQATYRTDFSHYSYFVDKRCERRAVIDLGKWSESKSYLRAEKAWLKSCKEGQRNPCVLDEIVVVTGKLRSCRDSTCVDVDTIAVDPSR